LLTVPSLIKRFSWLILGFTTRRGGDSLPPYDSFNCALHVGDQPEHVLANRKWLAASAGFSLDHLVCAEQVHKDAIYEVTLEDKGRGSRLAEDAIPATDGLYTVVPGLLLTSFYADCVPLYFIDSDQKVVGLAHAGWRGTVLEIGPKMVRRFQEQFNSRLQSLQVVIGPAIGPCCYEVDDVVIDALRPNLHDHNHRLVQPVSVPGKYRIDLKRINAVLLNRAGIPEQNIYQSSLCTSCQNDLFFSYRRDNGQTGRMASFIAIKGA
jgi:hypothetical protein